MGILKISKIFCILLLFQFLEIAVLGSGRLIQFGPLTLRMYIFMLLIFSSFFLVKKLNLFVVFSYFLFLSSLLLSIFIGVINNNNLIFIIDDVKPLLFFLQSALIYKYLSFNSFTEQIHLIYKSVGIFLSFLFLGIIFLIYFQAIQFSDFYQWASNQNDFVFRPQENSISEVGFFYKGFLYVGVSFFFFVHFRSFISYLIQFIIFLSIVFTLTRGLILSLLITYFMYLFFEFKNKILLYVILISFVIYVGYSFYDGLIGDKQLSNSIRIDDFNYILDNLSFPSFFFGNGFGSMINDRSSVENSFLDVFYNQGVFGLLFYFFLLFRISYLYIRYFKGDSILFPFFYGSAFIFLESMTNPFINNPIGMAFVSLSFLVFEKYYSLKTLNKKQV